MSAKKARLEMNSVLKHDLNACPDVDDTIIYPGSLDDAWLMPWNSNKKDLMFKMWMVESFESRETYRRAVRVCDEVDRFYSDLAKLHYADTGESSYMDTRAKRVLKMRLLSAMFPSWKTVVNGATGRKALKAKANLQRLVIENGLWLEKS